jgi:predicted nucleotidyltransferase/DNA-binding XRE family transcriptional regulator
MSDVAKLLRGARSAAAMSQAELARRAGTSQSALARYETGATLPTLPSLERILAACGRRLDVRAEPTTDRRRRALSVRGQLGPRARTLRKHRSHLLDVARERGVRRVRVFGSLARGEDAPTSDIDLLVDLDTDRTLLDLIGFRSEAEEILGTPVDVATVDMLKERIRREVETEAIPL